MFAAGTSFLYQGRLTWNGVPPEGIYDLTFSLFSAPNGGSPLGGGVLTNTVEVTAGVFSTVLDFGPDAFTGETWVDYENPGFFRLGTFELPFGSLGEAVALAPCYGRILVKPGSERETITVRKSLRIEAPLGPVTIER